MSPTVPLASIGPMHLDDVPTVVAIENAVFASPWSADSFTFDLTRRRHAHYAVARYLPWADTRVDRRRLDESIMGYAGAWFVVDEVHIATLAVRPEWRRRGVGELLFAALIHWAMAQGAAFATLEVRLSNTGAQHLYAKYQLERVGRRRRYYTDNREDALLMTNDHLQTPAYAAFLEESNRALEARLQETLAAPPALMSLASRALNT